MSVIIDLAVVCTVFLASLYVHRYLRRSRDDVYRLRGPSKGIASWLWGHELLAFEHDANDMYSTWTHVFGPIFRIKAALGHPDIIVASDHAAVQYIFADTENYVKSPAFRPPVANVIGKGLVWAEGDEHKLMRRILAPAFSPESIKGMADVVSECAEKLESKLTNEVLSHNGDGVTVNMTEHSSTATLDIIGRVAFGHDFKAMAAPHASTSGAQTDAQAIAASWLAHVRQGLKFSAFLAPIVVRAIPSITSAPLPLMQTQGQIKLIVRRLAGRLVDAAKKGGAVGKGKDILSILMRARKEGDRDSAEGKEGRSTNEERLNDEQILDNIVTFTMVGHETTAATVNFTLLDLAQHPQIQQKLRDEVLASPRDLGYDDIQRMTYLDAVVKEALRVHPASPQTERIALKDDVIPLSKPVRTADGTTISSLRVSKGQVIYIPFRTMHTDPTVWGADAGVYQPERWITPGGIPPPSALPHGWSGLVTFCDGPRNCIGFRLAIFEMKVILATLIRSLQFHDTGAVVHSRISPTLQPVTDGEGGVLPLRITLAPTS
ncbi:hypothetical protein PLICRDRAFT_42386 [Plicaturopsis crispa FD-325 SS-3]|nr:hypothetical protein PLICRDRAFT_42386 [Plicaturopsis crispa FD-325 SS-3]